jgi:hypothetical protein
MNELELIRALDSIQRDIWRGINEEAVKRGVKWKTGDAYCLASTIKETLHPRVKALLKSQLGRLKEQAVEYTKTSGTLQKHETPVQAIPMSALEAEIENLEKL